MSTVNVKRLWLNKPIIMSFFSWILLGLLLAIDQFTKWWYQMRDLVIFNGGGVFGIFPSWGWALFLIIVWGIIVRYWILKPWDMQHWGMGFIIVGGLGNIVDRLLFGGSVRDFIYYPVVGFYGNVADIFLAIGVIIVMFCQTVESKEQRS